MSPNVMPFAIIFVVAVLLFIGSCYSRFRLVLLGSPENRFKNVGTRLKNVVIYPFAQLCTINRRYRFGINHAVLFWCFMVLLIANAEFLLHGLFPSVIALSKLPTGLYFFLAFVFDIVSILALLAVILAVIRRLAFPPKYMEARSRDAFTILTLVGGLMIAFFGLHGTEIAAGEEEAAVFMPISSLVSGFFNGAPAQALENSANVFWWIHAIVLLGFLNYLPYSKHMHILTSIPNCYFKSLEKVTTQPREEFKKGKAVYGAGTVDQYRWKDLFDSYSCTECGRCTDQCPANYLGKELNPRLIVHDIKVNLINNGPLLLRGEKTNMPLIGEKEEEGTVSETALWQCTTCGACMEICPVFIEHVPKIVGMRRDLVEMKSKFPDELLIFFENTEQRSNPWGIAPADRAKWAADISIKPFKAGETEYLWYVGCSGSFDARNRQVSLAMAKIMDAAGVSFGILGREEKCCGDSVRRLGNEFVFDRITRENIKMYQEKGIKKIITQCPHCYNVLKNDYRQYGADFEVIHHTEFIDSLIKDGKLKLNKNNSLGNVVFHDSCYLGRYNEIYEAPREVVASAIGTKPTEMDRQHNRSYCCGAGGGRMWMEEELGMRLNSERTKEALSKNPNTICVCCPYCMTMFEDGLKEQKADNRVQVLDLAEIVAKSL